MRIRTFLCRSLQILAAVVLFAGSAVAQELPELALDWEGTTVSGLSSGAFMAVQMHVAFSERVKGAGIVAGGPYYCSRGQVLTALERCMDTRFGPPDADSLLATAKRFAAAGEIDPLSGLEGDRVYLFTGTEDHTVTRPVVDAARDFYLAAGVAADDIEYVTDVAAGHGFVTEDGAVPCGVTAPAFINDCDIDQAGDILSWLYGENLGAPLEADPSRLIAFDQSRFLPNPEEHGMDARGFVYVPARCAAGEMCRLHIAFHGCEQTPDQIGDLFARTAGYNRWAEAAGIVVLYPQAQVIPSPLFDPFGGNPKGCWDWFGYDDRNFAKKKGRQMAAVAAMAAHLGAPLSEGDGNDEGDGEGDVQEVGGTPYCERHTGFNSEHLMFGRAYFCGFGIACAAGTGEFIGPPFAVRTLFESPRGRFSTTPCE